MYFTDEELIAFYKRLEDGKVLKLTPDEAKKLLNVLRAYDSDNTCVLPR